jgi:hypothetical protein
MRESLSDPGAPRRAGAAVRFQSIADLYNNDILPLYREAFAAGCVGHNTELAGELDDPGYAQEGFLHSGRRVDAMSAVYLANRRRRHHKQP